MIFNTVAIIGVGLIGGSLGMVIKKEALANRVIGIDIDDKNLVLAKQLSAIDQGYPSVDQQAVSQADLVILAAPISVNLQVLQDIKPYLKPGTIVTDVGSTKSDFVSKAQTILGDKHCFIGGHPMAGSEIAGIKGSDPYLFENAIYILTPTKQSAEGQVTRLKQFITALGAICLVIDPNDHDLMVAAISHLPHLVAAALVNTAAEIGKTQPETLFLAAGGFKDITRIASSNPRLWRDICFNNQSKLTQVIEVFRECLQRLSSQLDTGAQTEFCEQLAQAKTVRDSIPTKLKGYWPFLEDVIVTIPDKPGMIGTVAAILGERGVNIDDIEILRVREGEGGSLRLGFATKGAGEKAVGILTKNGFLARLAETN